MQDENSWFKQGKEMQLEVLQYIENKWKRDLLKHSESMQTGSLNPDTAASPEPNKTGIMGSMWKQGRTERIFTPQRDQAYRTNLE